MYKAIKRTGAVSMCFQHCFAERPAARYAPYQGFLVYVCAVTLFHFALQPSRRHVRLLRGLAQIKCQVCCVTMSAVDFVTIEKVLQYNLLAPVWQHTGLGPPHEQLSYLKLCIAKEGCMRPCQLIASSHKMLMPVCELLQMSCSHPTFFIGV